MTIVQTDVCLEIIFIDKFNVFYINGLDCYFY